MADPYKWRRTAHIPLIIVLQIIFIILFAKFVVYDEHTAIKNVHFDKGVHHKEGDTEIYISEQKEDAKPEPSADGVKDGKDAPLHETTRDAKETLTDYPSMLFSMDYLSIYFLIKMVFKHIKNHIAFLSFSVSGCACHDFYWIWISNDFPEEIRVECRVT